jgi:hypothetical protein
MLYVSIVIVISLIVIYLISLKNIDKIFEDIDKGEHKLYFLYPMAHFCLIKTGLEKKVLKKIELSKKIRALYVSKHHDIQTRLYWYQKVSLILLIIFVFSCFSIITSVKSAGSKHKSIEVSLIRPENGHGDSLVKLRFTLKKETDKEDIYEDEIVIKNKERIYTQEEWEEVLHEAIPYLEIEMLGDNKDANNVDNNLNFIKKIPETGIKVEWIPKDYKLISDSGQIKNRDLLNDRTDTQVTAILKYQDIKVEHIMALTILPVELDEKETLYKKLEKALDLTQERTTHEKEWVLPKGLEGYLLIWKTPEGNSGTSILLLGLLVSIIIWFSRDKELDKKMRLRNNEMLLDYPEIINKFNLLVNAGMTIKQAWTKISEDYKYKAESNKKFQRYAYEEMLLTLYELRLGVAEVNAYEQFGMRVSLLPYMKFGSMLVQNLKKGNKNMVDLLKREAMEAFHERKEITKRLGEEASTKLLGPMIIMLFIVLVIIIIPAFISFGI